MAEALDPVTDASFPDQVQRSSAPFLVEFSSPQCEPCKALEPVLVELAADLAGRLRIGQVNIVEAPQITERFGVLSTPSMILFVDGEPVRRLVGAKNKRNLLEALTEYLPA